MSARNKPLAKKVRRLERSLRKGRLPAFFDLIKWLIDHDYADTKGQARQIIRDGKVKVDSHTLGTRWALTERDTKVEVFEQFVPFEHYGRVQCDAPKKRAWMT